MQISFNSKERPVKSIVEQIEKQQITVGSYIQELILNKKKEEGKEVKTVRDYMQSQRQYCWETWRASNLIRSLLLGIPIPEITEYRHDDKSQFRKCLDGQQRLTSIYLFVKDHFKLDLSKSIFPVFEIEEEQYTYQDLHDKLFSQLPELLQDIILDKDIRLTTINNCDEEQAEKFFVSMNAGVKPLKAAEVRTAAMGMSTRKFFRSVLQSDWVLHTMTAKSATGNPGNEVMAQMVALLHHKEPVELSKGNIDNVIYSFRNSGVPEDLQNDITDICNYLNEVANIWIEDKKRNDEQQKVKRGKRVTNYSTYRFTCFNKTHIVMLMMAAHKAIKNNVSIKAFAEWSLNFFKEPSQEYKTGLVGKAIDLNMVELRLNAIDAEVDKLNKEEVKQQSQQEQQPEPNNNDAFNTIVETIEEVERESEQAESQDNQEQNQQQESEVC